MLYTNGAIITDVRGSIGGQTYSKNRYGKFVCNKYSPTNMRTAAQQLNRRLLAQSVYSWRNLSEHERLSWNSAAMYLKGYNCFGDSFSYTAYQCYIKCNTIYLYLHGDSLTSCPAIFRPSPLKTFSFTINLESQLFMFDYSLFSDSDTAIMLYATKPLAQGRKPKKSDYRRFFVNFDSSLLDSDVTNAYVSYFGSFPSVGKVVYISAVLASMSNGLLSSLFTASAVCSSYLQDITPYNLQQANWNPATKVLSLNASTSAFAALTACDFSKPFSFRFRLLTVSATAVLRCNFASINTQIPVNDSRNRYRILPNPTNHAWIFNLLGSTLGGAPVVSVYNYVVFSYDGSKLLVYSGSSFDDLTLYGSFSVVFSGVGYINFCLASANATQIDSIAFNQ